MKKVTKYVAIDNKEFYTKEECLKYEKLIETVDEIMNQLPLPIESSDFCNGSGYIQHDIESLKWARIKILELCKIITDHKWIQQTLDDDSADPSWVQRIIGEYDVPPLVKAWNRFCRIDKQYREWGQQYFVRNPQDAKQIQLN